MCRSSLPPIESSVHIRLCYSIQYSWLSLSRTRLSRITAYLEVKIWSLPKHENLTTCKNIVEKRRNCSQGAISPLFHNIFNISLTSRVQLHIYLLNVVNRISFSSILQIWYVEVRISRSISESSLEFEITRVDCICISEQRKPLPGWSMPCSTCTTWSFFRDFENLEKCIQVDILYVPQAQGFAVHVGNSHISG